MEIDSCEGTAVHRPLSFLVCLASVVALTACPPTPTPPPDPEPPAGKLVVNEVNCSKNPDEFIEVKNVSDVVVDTAGFAVSGDPEDTTPFPVPPRKLDPGERVMITGDIGLSCKNEGAVLFKEGVVVDEAPVRTGDPDRATWGRLPDGTGDFAETAPTPQKENRAFVDERGSVFDDEADVAVVDLFVDASVEETLRAQSKGAGYVPALFQYTDSDGTSPPQRVDVRLKGSISLRPWDDKPGMKIHFARHGEKGPTEFRGLRKMTLNNLTYDPSFIREFLAYEVMAAAGHAAPRVSWVNVFVNGEDKGLYSTIETYDRVFLADHYDGTEVMYESDGLTPAGNLGGFDVDEGPEDFEPLNALATHLSNLGSTNVIDDVPEVDWAQVARISALEDLLAHFDGHKGACHNFFLHLDKNGSWTLLPWSVDLTLVTGAFDTQTPLGSCGQLSQLCDTDTRCRAMFERERDAAAQLVLNPPDGTSWHDLVTPIARRLQPFARATDEPFRGNEFWQGVGTDLEQNADDAVTLLETRAKHIRCATSVARGEGVPDGEPADCHGFTASALGAD